MKFSILLLMSFSVLEWAVGFLVSWGISFVLCRYFLNRSFRPKYLNLLAVICGLLLSPVILAFLVFFVMWIGSPD